MFHVYLGLGSNVGQREDYLKQAVQGLADFVEISAESPVYETAAWGVRNQPDFLNMCLAGATWLTPFALLDRVKDLEIQIGRTPTTRWGPREIDIDILIYEELVTRSRRLDVPHKGMAERASVLVPLADIAPELIHPLSGLTVLEMLRDVETSGVKPYSQLSS